VDPRVLAWVAAICVEEEPGEGASRRRRARSAWRIRPARIRGGGGGQGGVEEEAGEVCVEDSSRADPAMCVEEEAGEGARGWKVAWVGVRTRGEDGRQSSGPNVRTGAVVR